MLPILLLFSLVVPCDAQINITKAPQNVALAIASLTDPAKLATPGG